MGSCLIDALNTMVAERSITVDAANKLLSSFDAAFPRVMEDAEQLLGAGAGAKARKRRRKVTIEGEISNFNHLNDYWKIDCKNVSLSNGHSVRVVDSARLLFVSTSAPRKARRTDKCECTRPRGRRPCFAHLSLTRKRQEKL